MAGQESPSFDPYWLEERFDHDQRARNRMIEAVCQAHLNKAGERLRIIDAGSGTGSNFLHLHRLWSEKDQHWYFLEEDPLLSEYAIQRLSSHFQREGFQTEQGRGALHLSKGKQKLEIDFITGSLLHIEELIDLSGIHLTTAGAVFDLLATEQFEAFFSQLHQNKIPLLATLNYTGMCFQPSHPEDDTFIKYYEAHMSRPQEFGRGMGKQCIDGMTGVFQQFNSIHYKGDSTWYLKEDDQAMHQYLFGFMESAIGEMLQSHEETGQLRQWLTAKRNQSKNRNLVVKVEHCDVFAIPDHQE